MVMRRRRAWSDTRIASAAMDLNEQSKDDLLAGLSPTETKTVSRILLDMHFMYDGDEGTESTVVVDLGIGVVSKEAFDLGTFPDANTIADYPQQGWLYVATLPLAISQPAAGGIHRLDAHFKADIRGQRKVDRGVLFMTQNATLLEGTDPGNIVRVGRIRALCLT